MNVLGRTVAHGIALSSFDCDDAMRIAIHRAVLEVHDEDLCSSKYVFDDASFLTIRGNNFVPVDPNDAQCLLSYARWIGVASEREVTAVSCLFNMLEAGSMRVH